ncbi:MAG: hypothetical protein IT306_27715 [Chloroflexi bacterium]|nr:hypothetical protein [Chloroflexota bacterium]
MRKLSSIAGAALLAVTAFASPASAQSGAAGGSCGTSAGAYGLTDLNSASYGSNSHGVPALFYTVNYSGVSAPTTVGVIVRYNGELESQQAVASFTAQNSGGSFDGAIRANISPEAQGGGNGIDVGLRGRSDGGPSQGDNQSGNGQGGRAGRGGPATQGSATQAGITPGEYVFYVYTGSRGDVYNVKDGTVALNAFIADEKGYLGSFSCGVSTDQGSGPG